MRGADALELAKQFQPTAVSLDVFLPDMLGWTVLSQLKQNPLTRHIPVQIVTLDEDRQHGLARGAFSFVTKPTTTEGVEARDRADQGVREAAPQAPARRRGQPGRAAEHPRAARHDDIEIDTAGTGARGARRACASSRATASCSTCGCPTCPASRCWSRSSATTGAVRRAGRRVHRPRALGRGGRAAAHDGAQHRGQGRRVARAAARRDRAVPAPRRHRPAAREAAHARAAQHARTRTWSAARCCWSTTTCATSSRSRSVLERRGMQRADRDDRQRGDRDGRERRPTSRSC